MDHPDNWKKEFEELKTVLIRFHGAFHEDDGIDLHQLQYDLIPPPLKAFYEFAGNRLSHSQRGIFSYNTFLLPWELDLTAQTVTFFLHEGGFYTWAAERHEENPKIIRTTENHERTYEVERLSGFLCQICLYETANQFPYQIHFHSRQRHALEEIAAEWQRFPFRPRPSDDTVIPNIFFYSHKALGFLWFGNSSSPKTLHTFYCGAHHLHDLEWIKPLTETKGMKDYTQYDEDVKQKGYWEFLTEHGHCPSTTFWSTPTERKKKR